MENKKNFIIIVSLYLLVILSLIIFEDIFSTVVFVIGLMIFHVFGFFGEREILNKINEDSLSKLLSKLNKTKKENEESYKRFISLTKTLGSGIIMVNEEGIINFSNKDFKLYFDVENDNLDYSSLIKIKPLYKFINEAYLLEKSLNKQIQYLEKYYDLVSTPLFEDDLFQGCLVVVHNITVLKTAESFQKQFTADVSHELKTPLSTIKGFSEILVRDSDMNKKERVEFLSLINKESTRMEAILSDLLIISKMDRLDYELNKEKTNIKYLIMENVDSLNHRIKQKNLKCDIHIEDCILEIDKIKIGQVILNLIKNAINYTDKGKIEIIGYIEKNVYKIKVIDTGIGISEINFEKIFKRFYRVDTARSRDSGGSGLGLSICKNVVLKHGGTISVDSVKNEGTTFEIILNIKK